MKSGIKILLNDNIVFFNARLTTSFFDRLKGLLGTTSLDADSPLIIDKCGSVHSFFMKYSIGVLYLNADRQVIGKELLRPNRLGRFYWRTRLVIECSSQSLDSLDIPIGTRISWKFKGK